MIRPLLLGLCSLSLFAQSLRPELYNDMRWRHIGPFRGGRTVAASGIASQPNVFYIAANNGGVWKTDDYGHTWAPLFDSQLTGSIGALAIAPSDPKVIYVGSGEGLHRPDLSVGNGMYKSIDGGRTWKHLGLDDAQQIPSILVDPRNPDRVYVAALGHPYGPNAERGVYRSDNGGATWTKILYKDENTGAIELAFAPDNPDIIYTSLWEAREGPWENGAWQGKNSGLYKSKDAGKTWTKLEKGLPTVEQGLGRIGLGISPSNPSTLYAMVDASASLGGVYRSDDAGATWRKRNGEMRVWGRGSDFAWVRVHPRDKETIFVANTSTYKSTDGGKTFRAWKGAPGGDDYHTIWINPINPETILLASDQGATITVNGGRTWSSWYNQPTAQFYHVITDNQWPYWVYGGQQESGSAGVKSRGDNGAITFRDWRTVGVEEYGYVAPDPLDSNIIYGGKATRFDARTGQVQDISPILLRDARYRSIRTMPLLFSPVDPHLLYLGANVVFRTANGGKSWDVISPDLTRESYELPASIGIFSTQAKDEAKRRGVVYSIAPSHQDVNTIWAGTDDGLIHITRDGGKEWKNVTPSTLTPWSKVSQLDASHFDNNTMYAAINRIRVDDQKPHILRTHDGGSTWTEIVKGLPDGPINTVREDPVHKGLLFAGSELAVYFSIDDGDNWMPLRLNMPATSIRDLVVHNDDVVVGTHGRGFWILDDITPLRQISAQTATAPAMLFQPQVAVRVRRNVASDTPLPPEEPAGQNPPDGAILNYWLAKPAAGGLTIEILDPAGKLVRRYTSEDKAPAVDPELSVPTYWLRTPKAPGTGAGMHRFAWDLHYAPPAALNFGYPISAIYGDTPREPLGPGVLPGEYTVKLTANGTSYTQPLQVRMDPRVTTPAAELEEQFRVSLRVYELIGVSFQALQEVRKAKDPRAAAFDGASSRFRRGAGGDNFAALNGQLVSVLDVLQGADAALTTQAIPAVTQLEERLNKLLGAWHELRGTLQ